jgi:hypothetical protein
VIRFARLLARVVGFVALLALALAGLALAIFSIGTGTSGPSLGRLATLLHLSSLRDTVGHWLAQLEAPGSVAVVAGLCGLAAVALGLLLLVGVLVPRRERLVTLDSGEAGALLARRHALAQLATTLVEQVRGVTRARVRVHPSRRAGGRLRVRAFRTQPADAQQVKQAVREQLGDLSEPFKLRVDARVALPRRSGRVQ